MKTINPSETILNNADDALRAQSKVTPKKGKSKIANHALFAGLLAVCAIYAIFSFMPSKKVARDESTTMDSNTLKGTLSQNLALIQRLKSEADALQAKNNAAFEKSTGTKAPKAMPDEHALTPELLARMNAPMSFDGSREGGDSANQLGGVNNPDKANAQSTLNPNNANAQFVNSQDDIVSVEAKRLPHPAFTIPAGEMIPATLEVAINSELPGMVRAITTRDVYSLIGEKPLIPKGSTLVGQFNAQVVQGQSRLLVVWNRVQMPDGVIVTLASPGTDMLGRSGMGADSIDRHFFDRFGSSVLLSILGGVTANTGVKGQDQYNSASQYRMGIATSLQQSAGQTLEQDMQIKPTLQINQGARITVFVARDLDFYKVGVPKTPRMAGVRGATWKQ
jgi:type IV secretion system protein VirB10